MTCGRERGRIRGGVVGGGHRRPWLLLLLLCERGCCCTWRAGERNSDRRVNRLFCGPETGPRCSPKDEHGSSFLFVSERRESRPMRLPSITLYVYAVSRPRLIFPSFFLYVFLWFSSVLYAPVAYRTRNAIHARGCILKNKISGIFTEGCGWFPPDHRPLDKKKWLF